MGCCGDIEFLEGGLLKEPTIFRGNISESNIKGLASVDEASAKTIANALAALPTESLQALAAGIFAALAASTTDAPDTTKASALPTLMYGDVRKGMLGAPDGWVALGELLLPGYTAADGHHE